MKVSSSFSRGRPDVRLVYLFGSTARGETRASSDLDVAILFEPLPAPAELDQLQTVAPPLLVHEIIKSGRRLVCRSEGERVHFETRANTRYLDTGYLRRVQHRYLRERVEALRARQR